MKLTNALTGAALIAGGLSLTEKVTFIVGLFVLILAAIANIASWRKHNAERKLAEKKLKDDEGE